MHICIYITHKSSPEADDELHEQARPADRASELIAEEMALRELCKPARLTQVSVTRELGISQDADSRLETA